ncbi:MAG: Ig-like domain-containing protein, partial [Ginsengibacter sp.]
YSDQLPSGGTSFINTAIQKDGKIITIGSNDFSVFVIARYNTDGNLDNTFSDDGIQMQNLFPGFVANSVAIQPDEKIVVVGHAFINKVTYIILFRFNTDGSLDNTFDVDGVLKTHFQENTADAVAVQGDGKIVVAGGNTDFVILRFNTNGSLDNTFSGDGRQITDFGSDDHASSIALQPDGKIIVAGSTGFYDKDYAIARYNTNGSLDNSFSNDGLQTTDFSSSDDYGNSLALQSDGKIVVAGGTSNGALDYSIARYNIDGTLNNNLSLDGKQTTDFHSSFDDGKSLALQSDGKIVVGGYSETNVSRDFALSRYNTDGSLDNSFSNDGKQLTAVTDGSNEISGLAIFDNKLYAVGTGNNRLFVGVVARYLLDDNTNTPPAVSLTSPSNNATFISPVRTLDLKANASSENSTITKVEFFNGENLLNTQTEAPYAFTWRNVQAGTYIITAVATDDNGRVSTSDPAHISVEHNKAPLVNFSKPQAGHIYASPATIRIEADATDPDGRIIKVEFYNGNILLAKELKTPYTFAWRNVPVGQYTVTAKAYDNWGASTSISVNIAVEPNKPPLVSLTSPVNNQTFATPAVINLSATASDPDGRIIKVEFYNGATLLATERKLPYTYQWRNVAAGTYHITAVATDNYGKKTTSATVTITVNAPLITMQSSLSIKNSSLENSIPTVRLTPNPVKNILNIYINGRHQDERKTILLLSSSGILLQKLESTSLDKLVQLNVSSIASGIYTVKIISGINVIYKQFVKL